MSEGRYTQLQEVAGPVSRETFELLLRYEEQFLKWSTRINLVAKSTLPELWSRHMLDSAQLLKYAPVAKHWLDLGSGGGFPGGVLAILLGGRPGASIDLVDSNARKTAFLKTVLGDLKAPARVHNRRIDQLSTLIRGVEVVTARALAPLPLLLELAEPWLVLDSRALFHKGRDYRRELEECRDAWQFDLVEHPSAVDREAVILDISGLRRK